MKVFKFNEISEAKGYPGLSKNFRKKGNYKVTAIDKNSNNIEFNNNTIGELYIDVIDWLNKNGYDFNNSIHIQKVRKVFSLEEIKSEKSYGINDFYEFDEDKYLMLRKINKNQIINNINLMFDKFNITNVRFIGFDEDTDDDFDPELEPIDETPSDSVSNTFGQSILVLGEAGAGKSLTTINVLKNDPNHVFKLLIPTEITNSLFLTFVRGNLELNMVSKAIIAAYKNPDKKYTIMIDEFHKSLTIRKVNDELLQAISKKRYDGVRFLSSDVATFYISEKLEEANISEEVYDYHGNIKIPDNFGFILLSSKPAVIVDNDDLYDRVDVVYIREGDRNSIKTVNDLDNLRISENSDKDQFKKIIKSSDKDQLDEFIDKFNN